MSNAPIYSGSGNYMNTQEREEMLNRRRTEVQRQQMQQSTRINERSTAFPVGTNQKRLRAPQSNKVNGRVFSEQKKGNIKSLLGKTAIGFIAALSVAGLTYSAAVGIKNHDQYKEIKAEIVAVTMDSYEEDLALMKLVPKASFEDIVEDKVDEWTKNNSNGKKFLRETKARPEVLAYATTGEYPGEKVTQSELFDVLQEFLPYANEAVVENNSIESMDEFFSIGSAMVNNCPDVDSVKADLEVALRTGIESGSVANSVERLELEKAFNKEAIEKIYGCTVEELRGDISTNKNNKELIKSAYEDEKIKLLKHRVYFHDGRQEFVDTLMTAPDTSPVVRKRLDKYSDGVIWGGVIDKLRQDYELTMNLSGISTEDEYTMYCLTRNEFYNDIINKKQDPEKAKNEWTEENEALQLRINSKNNFSRVEDKAEQISEYAELIKEYGIAHEKIAEANKNLQQAEQELKDTERRSKSIGFEDLCP